MATRNRPSLLSLAVLTLLVFVAGAVAYLIAVAPARRAARAQTWPEVACEITQSRVDVSKDHRGRTRSEPIVQYRYEVHGKAYTGSRIEFVGSYAGIGDLSPQVIRPYPQGLLTTCRVNPNDPSDSVLNPKASGEGVLVLAALFGGGFLVVLSAAAFYWWKFFRPSPASQ